MQKGEKMSETYAQGTPTKTIRIRNDLARTVQTVYLAKESVDEIAYAVIEKLNLSSAQPEIIHCRDCRYMHEDTIFGQCWCNTTSGCSKVNKDDFCSRAERRTDEQTD